MSISSLDLINQTTLVPNSLLGYSSNGVSAIEILPTSITIAGNLTTTPIYVGISASTGLTTNRPTGLDINCDFDMNGNDITELGILKFNAGLNISDQATDAQITSNNGGQLFLTCSNDLKLNVNNASIVELTPTNLTLTGNGTNGILMTSLNSININAGLGGGQTNITATDGVIISSSDGGIGISTGNGGNGSINLTSSGGVGISSGNGNPMTLSSDDILYLNSANNTQINAVSSFTAVAGDNVILTATNDAMTLSADDDITLTSISGNINLTTDLANNGNVKWNTYPMGITFFNKWDGGFNYGTPNNWEMVRQNTITFPTQFLYGTWAVQFSINCSNLGSQPSDKGLAMFFNFLDGASNTYNGFSYSQNYPYANWFNPSTYNNTSQTPLSITYTDYFDFTGAVNNLELQINWYADNAQNQNNFFVSTTFTLMTLI